VATARSIVISAFALAGAAVAAPANAALPSAALPSAALPSAAPPSAALPSAAPPSAAPPSAAPSVKAPTAATPGAPAAPALAPFDAGVAAAARGDFAAAVVLYQQAADKGDSRAEFILGVMYANGQGVPQDLAAAANWYAKAADAGEAGAQYSLGVMYRDGQGVPQDADKAAYWFGRAANPDLAQAGSGDTGLPPLPRLTLSLNGSFSGGPGVPNVLFREMMNTVFGPSGWRETGGYRPPEREDELRAEGALTVPVGHISPHSTGTPDAPGAYDIVVAGMTPEQAAEALRRSGLRFRRIFPEGGHGTQGPHLHVEPSPEMQAALEAAPKPQAR